MNCLSNLERSTFTLDMTSKLLKLYEYRGKEFYYREVLSQEFKTINDKAIEKDAFYLGKIFNLNITENRMRLLIEKGLDPKNKEEVFLQNIKKTLINLNKSIDSFEYIPSDISQMTNDIFKDIEKVSYVKSIERVQKQGFFHETQRVSNEEVLRKLLKIFESKINNDKYEKLLVISGYYIDFINQKNYNSKNDEIMMILNYILLAKNGFEVVRYVSFYEKIFNKFAQYKDSILQSSYNWIDGYSHISTFHQVLVSVLLECYMELEKKVDYYKFDSKNKKTDNLENIILKGPEIFSKSDLRKQYPLISDSTINRTLERMKNDGLITPIGEGRSAKWRKVVKIEKKISAMEQTTLFDVEQEFLK